MSVAASFTKKVLDNPELAQVSFAIGVLDAYLSRSDAKVSRTNTVGRLKTSSWTLDFGIAPDEASIHAPIAALKRLPEGERAHWLAHVRDEEFSQNFLKMQSAHSCIDDGGFRAWGEEEPLI